MKGLLQQPARVSGRMIWLLTEIAFAIGIFLAQTLARGRFPDLEHRALWLQRTSRRVLRILKVSVTAAGPAPRTGALVSNHLSYVDILVLSSLLPAVFVAKREVKSWPAFGWCARLAGTLFINREKRSDVGRANREIREVLQRKVVLVLFPEGTSSGGASVLPFKSPLLEPVTDRSHPLAVAVVDYALPDGSVADDVCYWRDMTFFPHLLNLLSKRGVAASVRFSAPQNLAADRKALARQLHAEAIRLQAEGRGTA